MEHQIEIQCESCEYRPSRPMDSCPLCGARFFWMLEVGERTLPDQVEAFVSTMSQVTNGEAQVDVLTHGGNLWLPATFWECDPDGKSLAAFSWIDSLQYYQDTAEEDVAEEELDSNQSSDEMKDIGHEVTSEELVAPSSIVIKATTLDDLPTKPVMEMGEMPAAEPRPVRNRRSRSRRPVASSPPDWSVKAGLGPVLILVFFILLSLAYIALRYHKNTRNIVEQGVYEVVHEFTILS